MKFTWVRENICERMPAFPVLWLCTAFDAVVTNGFLMLIALNVLVLVGVFTKFAR